MKVLLSAYACEPGQGSEPGVGWNMVREMAKHHEIWVLTQSDGRFEIEAELKRNPVPTLHFIFFDPFFWKLDLWKAKVEIQLHYYLWQIQAYFIGRSLHQQMQFDLIHHVTFVKYWGPSFLSLLPAPFLWGPVGGGETAPKPFWKDFSIRGQLYEKMRDLARWFGEQDPFTRLTAQRSVLAFATTEDTAKRLHCLGAGNIQVFSEAALSKQEIERLSQYPILQTARVRFISIGRHLHWKGFHLGLKAFLKADLPDAEYWLVGDGPERQRLEKIAHDSSKRDQIKFWGKLPRAEVLEKLSGCHVLVHPSLHDSGGWTCLEAMASGRPVICLNLGGPGVQINNETGIKVAARNPDQVIEDLAEAMTRLSIDSDLRNRLGQHAKAHVREEFSWETKACRFSGEYSKLVINV